MIVSIRCYVVLLHHLDGLLASLYCLDAACNVVKRHGRGVVYLLYEHAADVVESDVCCFGKCYVVAVPVDGVVGSHYVADTCCRTTTVVSVGVFACVGQSSLCSLYVVGLEQRGIAVCSDCHD